MGIDSQDELKKAGLIRVWSWQPLETQLDLTRELDEDLVKAYQWMESQYTQRLTPVTDSLIWVWESLESAVLQQDGLDPSLNYQLWELVVPIDTVLWSDFEAWHFVITATPENLVGLPRG